MAPCIYWLSSSHTPRIAKVGLRTLYFKKQRASLNEGNNGGVAVKIVESTEPGPLYQHANGNMVEASNVGFSEEIAGQISAKHLFSANVAVHKTSDEVKKAYGTSWLRIPKFKGCLFPVALN